MAPPVDTQNCILEYKQIRNDNIVKHSRNNIKCLHWRSYDKYCTLINT